jgi:hypothetical protein
MHHSQVLESRIRKPSLPHLFPPHQSTAGLSGAPVVGVEIPQQRHVAKAVEPVVLLNEVARILDRDLNDFRQSQRISRSDKDDRDLLVFFLRKTGSLTNERIGHFFGLTDSSVSHIVRSTRNRL